MKVISRIPAAKDERNDTYTITPTLVKNGVIHIGLPDADNKLKANVRIFDTNGALKHQTYITESTEYNLRTSAWKLFCIAPNQCFS